MKYLSYSKIWIGSTVDLLRLKKEGRTLKYEAMGTLWDVDYAPRSPYDPLPFLQVGGLNSRLRSTEIHARNTHA
jgi:hypothetical protein